MNAVGIDVSKGKSMIAIMRPLGEVIATPFEVGHTAAELNELAKFILKISGETRVVMEYTGVYFEPIATALYDAGLCVCVVHAQLIHNYGNNTIRKVKTDKADAIKIFGDNAAQVGQYVGELADQITGANNVELWKRVVYQIGFTIVPMLLILACLLVTKFTYKINEENHAMMVEKIKERNNKNGTSI